MNWAQKQANADIVARQKAQGMGPLQWKPLKLTEQMREAIRRSQQVFKLPSRYTKS